MSLEKNTQWKEARDAFVNIPSEEKDAMSEQEVLAWYMWSQTLNRIVDQIDQNSGTDIY